MVARLDCYDDWVRFLTFVALIALALPLGAQQDPVLQYNRSVGGVEFLFLATDPAGDILAVGRTNNSRLVLPAGGIQPRFAGGTCGTFSPYTCYDVVVLKFRASDGETIAGTFLGGTGDDLPTAVAMDAQGFLYIGGTTTSRNFPVSEGAFQNTNRFATGTGFVAKVHTSLRGAAFSTYLGGSNGATRVTGIAPDPGGNAYVTGVSDARDYPVTTNAFNTTRGTGMAFVTRITGGGGLGTSTMIGVGTPAAIVSDASGHAVITGTASDVWPVTTNAFQLPRAGGADVFVTRVTGTGGGLIYSTFVGGTSNDQATDVVVDAANNVYVSGVTYSSSFPGTSEALGEVGTGFVLKFTDTALAWTRPIRANGVTTVSKLQVGADGNLIATGVTQSTHFPTTSGAYQRCVSPGAVTSPFYMRLGQDGAIRLSTLLHENVTGEEWATTLASGEVVTLNRPTSPFEAVPPSNLRRYAFNLAPAARLGCVVSAASYRTAGITPGMVVTLFGSGMGPAQGVIASLVDGKVPTSVGGVRVLFNGTPAPLLFVREDQINAVVPFSVAATSTAEVRVEYAGASIAPVSLPVKAVEPGIFRLGSTEFGAILNEDGSLNTPANPAARGSVITFWGTGTGPYDAAYEDGMVVGANYSGLRTLMRVLVGGVAGELLYAGSSPDMVAGVTQVNLRLASNTRVSSRVPIAIMLGDTTLSEVAYVSVK